MKMPMKMTTKMPMMHPGFKAAQAKIARAQGIPVPRAGTSKASPKAKKANPFLKRVKG